MPSGGLFPALQWPSRLSTAHETLGAPSETRRRRRALEWCSFALQLRSGAGLASQDRAQHPADILRLAKSQLCRCALRGPFTHGTQHRPTAFGA